MTVFDSIFLFKTDTDQGLFFTVGTMGKIYNQIDDELAAYRKEKNAQSIDDLPGLDIRPEVVFQALFWSLTCAR